MHPICFEVVPDATRPWNPEMAPQAMVMNRKEVHGWRLDGGVEDEQPERQEHETGDELVGIQVVAGLEEHPHRQYRRYEGVEEQDPHPGGDGEGGDDREGLRERVPLEDRHHQDRVAHQGGQQDPHASAIHEPAEDEGDQDLHVDGKDRARVSVEQRPDDEREHRQHDPDQQ
jgi:hypothetical protein